MDTCEYRCGRNLPLHSVVTTRKHHSRSDGKALYQRLTHTAPVPGLSWNDYDLCLGRTAILLPMDRIEHTCTSCSETPLVYIHWFVSAVSTVSWRSPSTECVEGNVLKQAVNGLYSRRDQSPSNLKR